MNELSGTSNVRIIELNDIFYIFLRKWRLGIVISFVLFLALGGYKFSSYYRLLNDDEYIQNQEKSYYDALNNYEVTKHQLEIEIENIKDSINYQEEYLDNSIKMQINPYNKFTGILSFYVKTEYKIIPEMFYQDYDYTNSILRAYQTLSSDGDMYQFIKDNYSTDIDIKYLKEIITVYNEFDNKMLFICVDQINEELLKETCDLIIKYYNKVKDDITEVIGEHTLTILSNDDYNKVDLDLLDYQNNQRQLLTNLKKNLTEKEKELEALKEPNNNVLSINKAVISSFKYGLLGFIIGIILIMSLSVTYYIISDKMLIVNDAGRRLKLKVLGTLHINGKRRFFRFIDKYIEKLIYNISAENDEEKVITHISSFIRMLIFNEGESSIIFTGSIEKKDIDYVVSKINDKMPQSSNKISAANNICYDSEALVKINEANAVILVEKLNSSTYREINKQIEYINDLGKKIIGIVVID